jgi:lipopolysaccharide/colanic/teichoic acid biosynthesis glycosyltransferase
MKRAFDVCLAALGLVITSPLLAIISILIKIDSRGPVIFRQVRVGQGFRPFAIQKSEPWLSMLLATACPLPSDKILA